MGEINRKEAVWVIRSQLSRSTGQTIDFMLSAERDARAAKRLLRKMLKAPRRQSPRVINADRSNASPPAIEKL
jgi:transposase-like protein